MMMQRGAVVVDPKPGWAAPLYADLLPGAHAIVLGGAHAGIEARRVGFEIRDTILVSGEGSALILRRPIEAPTVAAQVADTATGAMWIDGCRIGPNPGYRYNAERNGTTFHGEQGARMRQTAGKRGSATIESTQGRWPTNLVFVRYKLGGGASRFYPRYEDRAAAMVWLERLILGPGANQ